jgi:signal transduction histidine kinase
MAALKGFIDNMLGGVTGELNERQSEYLRRMQNGLDRLTRLIAQLLDWSRLEMGGAPLSIKAVVPGDLVRAVVDHARPIAEGKQLRVVVNVEDGLPTILMDPDKIEQVLWNVIGNAIKFSSPSGTITIDLRSDTAGGIECSVSDKGSGIAPEDIPKVFEQFSGVSSSTPSARGAQLGLYISKTLVELHGGRMSVESALGRGSRFAFHLPPKPPEREMR